MAKASGRFLIAAALACAAWVRADAQQVSGIAIFEHGIYTADLEDTIHDPSGIDRDVVANLCHVSTTRTIPVLIGLRFGFRYRLEGPVAGQTAELQAVTRFPDSGVSPPEAAAPITRHAFPIRQQIGAESYTGYTFDRRWEMVLGKWSLEIWHRGRRLGGVDFDAVDGAGASVPAPQHSECFRVSRL